MIPYDYQLYPMIINYQLPYDNTLEITCDDHLGRVILGDFQATRRSQQSLAVQWAEVETMRRKQEHTEAQKTEKQERNHGAKPEVP